MSEHDYDIANAAGAAVRADVNNALGAVATRNAKSSAPATTFANMAWADTGQHVERRRDEGNTAFIITDTLDSDRVLLKTANYTVGLRDFNKLILIDASSGAVALTTPPAVDAGEGFRFKVKALNVDNAATVDGNAAETVDGNADFEFTSVDQSIEVWCDGANWRLHGGASGGAAVPRSYLAGLGLQNNGLDADHDLDIAAGICRSDENLGTLELAAVETIAIDATFVEGGPGARDSGDTLDADTWYHAYLIGGAGKTTSGFLSTSAPASVSLPSGFTLKRRLGSVLTDGSANIIGFNQIGDEIFWDDRADDVSAVINTTEGSRTLRTLSVPLGVKVRAVMVVGVDSTSNGVATKVVVTSPDETDVAPSDNGAGAAFTSFMTSTQQQFNHAFECWTNVSSQVGTRGQSTAGRVNITTLGYIDRRGRDG